MTECYRYAVDTYEQMTDEAKSKISLELLYNAICYYHRDATEIVQKLIHMDQPALAKLEKSLDSQYSNKVAKYDVPSILGSDMPVIKPGTKTIKLIPTAPT